MTHNQALAQAQIEGVQAAKEGKLITDNPYHVSKDHAYYSAWYVGFKSV